MIDQTHSQMITKNQFWCAKTLMDHYRWSRTVSAMKLPAPVGNQHRQMPNQLTIFIIQPWPSRPKKQKQHASLCLNNAHEHMETRLGNNHHINSLLMDTYGHRKVPFVILAYIFLPHCFWTCPHICNIHPVDFCMLPPPMTEPKELKNAKTAAWLNGPMMSNWSDCGCKMP